MMDHFILEDHHGITVLVEVLILLLYITEAYLLMKLIHMLMVLFSVLTLSQLKIKSMFT